MHQHGLKDTYTPRQTQTQTHCKTDTHTHIGMSIHLSSFPPLLQTFKQLLQAALSLPRLNFMFYSYKIFAHPFLESQQETG